MVASISSTNTEAPFLYSVAFLIGTYWNAQTEGEHGDQVAEPSRACKIHVLSRLPSFWTAHVSLISDALLSFQKQVLLFWFQNLPQITDRSPSCIWCYFPYMFNDKGDCISSGPRTSWLQSERADFLSQHIFKGALWNCLNKAHSGVLFVWNLAFCKLLAHGVFWTPWLPGCPSIWGSLWDSSHFPLQSKSIT